MSRELISRVFKRDFHKLLGFDIFRAVDNLEIVLDQEGFNDLVIPAFVQPIREMTINLMEIMVRYLSYDPDRFEKPMDQYVYIYENKERILEIIARGLEVENPFDCPIGYTIGHRLNTRFERLFRHILTVGKTHQFNEDYIIDHLLDDVDDSVDPDGSEAD